MIFPDFIEFLIHPNPKNMQVLFAAIFNISKEILNNLEFNFKEKNSDLENILNLTW